MAAFGLLAPEFVLLVALAFAIAALEGYRFSFHPLLQGVAWLLSHLSVHIPGIGGIGPGSWLEKQVHQIDKQILAFLSAAVLTIEQQGVLMFQATGELASWIGTEIAGLAKDTGDGLERLGGKAYGPLRKLIYGAIVIWAAKHLRRLLTFVTRPLHVLQRLVHRLLHDVVAVEHALGHWRGYTARQLRALLRRLAKLGWLAGVATLAALGHLILKRLHLKWLLGYRTLAAFGLAILARLGLQWLTCRSTGKAGRGVCGMDESLLDELLTDVLLIAGLISLREMTEELQELTEPAVAIMRAGIREF